MVTHPDQNHEKEHSNETGQLFAVLVEEDIDRLAVLNQINERKNQQRHCHSRHGITKIDESVQTSLGGHLPHGELSRLRYSSHSSTREPSGKLQ